MVEIGAVIALLLFVYVSRSVQKRRINQRDIMNERREEHMQRFLESKKTKGDDEENESGNKSIGVN